MVRKAALAALAFASIALAMTAGTTAPALAAPATAGAASAVTSYGQLPVMGYNPWYQYGVHVTEAGLLHQANLLVSTGLAAAGYGGLYLDDGWMASARTTTGALTWDMTKFPHGIPALASQVHALGLKFGIYEAIGTRTCKNFPGSYGHYVQDAQTFASWGVDYVKIDSCGGLPAGTTEAGAAADFTAYGSALRGAAMVYSQELPIPYIGTSYFLPAVQTSQRIADSWRVTNDESPALSASTTILGHLAADLHLHGFAGPGHWNDLDMLVSGVPVFGWTLAQQESQLSVWAEEASPLLLSTDIQALTSAELSALKNPYMIAIDQSGAQAPKAIMAGHIEALMKPYPGGGVAVLLANLGTGTASGRFTLSQFGITTARGSGYNVWTGKTNTLGGIAVTMGAGQTMLFILKAA